MNISTITIRTVSQAYSYLKSINYDGYKNGAFNFLQLNKGKIILYFLGGSYITLCSFLFYQNYYFNHTDLWGTWKGDLSFAQLCEIPQQKLSSELLHEIQKRYINKNNPTDFLSPLVEFMNTIEYETKQIERYIFLTNWLKRLRLVIIVPTNEKKMQKTQQLLERVHFVKHIFLSWAADYKLTHKRFIYQ